MGLGGGVGSLGYVLSVSSLTSAPLVFTDSSALTTPSEEVWSPLPVVQVGRGRGEMSTSSSELPDVLRLTSSTDLLTSGLPPAPGTVSAVFTRTSVVGVAGREPEWAGLGEGDTGRACVGEGGRADTGLEGTLERDYNQ